MNEIASVDNLCLQQTTNQGSQIRTNLRLLNDAKGKVCHIAICALNTCETPLGILAIVESAFMFFLGYSYYLVVFLTWHLTGQVAFETNTKPYSQTELSQGTTSHNVATFCPTQRLKSSALMIKTLASSELDLGLAA